MTIEELVDAYIRIRDEIRRKEEEHAAEIERLKNDLHEIADELRRRMQQENVRSINTEHGVVMLTTKSFARVADWDSFLKFVIERNEYGMLTRAVNKSAVRDYLQTHGELPDGVDFIQAIEVSVRKN